jgi:HK97 family phage prohead protease
MSIQYHKADPVELEFQFRSLPDGTSTFEGYAAVFNQPSSVLNDELARTVNGYTETILPGAFRRTLGSGRRTTFVVDHNERMMISSAPNGALRMAEDSTGLHIASPAPRTDYVDNVRALQDAGERLGMSMYFATPRGGDEWNARGDQRNVKEAILRHVSVLASMEPAYSGTSAMFRNLANLTESDVEDVDALMTALRDGRKLDEGEYNLLTKLSEAVKPETDESTTPVVEPETDAERAATEKWLERLAKIEAELPKS